MAHELKDNSHHDHDHAHDHHHHGHDGDHHHWDTPSYVDSWLKRDASRRGERGPFLERLVAAVPFRSDAEIEVLDVGAGSGIVADAVLAAFPRARITLQDYSEPMLARARASFAGRAGHCPTGWSSSGPPPLSTVIERWAAGLVAIPIDCGPPLLSAVRA